jgi:hypothetical protein
MPEIQALRKTGRRIKKLEGRLCYIMDSCFKKQRGKGCKEDMFQKVI